MLEHCFPALVRHEVGHTSGKSKYRITFEYKDWDGECPHLSSAIFRRQSYDPSQGLVASA
jgi:hypothetical protein